jgi:hypothetical protein
MKKVVASAVVWAGLWSAGMWLYEQAAWESKPLGSWFRIMPVILAAALAAWGAIGAAVLPPGKGANGALVGALFGLIYGIGAFVGSYLLAILLASVIRGDIDTAARIACLTAGGIVGAIAGACVERDRQGMR